MLLPVGLTNGIVTGVSGGTSTIIYTSAAGCSTSAVVTVNPLSPIAGTFTLCQGNSTILTDIVTGGTWSSSVPGIASIVSGSGLVTAIASGVTTITYLLPTGCFATATFTVINVAAITGTPVVCVGSTTILNDATTGGAWSSLTPGVAAIGAGTGVVTGITTGTSIITYTSPGTCTTTIVVTVNPIPQTIAGITTVCAGLTTSLSDITPGGIWSSNNAGIASINTSGTVTGISAGIATITYKLPTGCFITTSVVVNPLPAAIGGVANICVGSSINLNDAITGGTWASSNTTSVTIGLSTGVAIGVSQGVSEITYTLPTGCIITAPVTVVPVTVAPVTANLNYCQYDTAAILTAIGSNLLWYTSATTGIGSTVAPTPNTTIPGTYTWFVSQTVNGCEGPRSPLVVIVHTHPVFSIAPVRPNACQYDTISFYCAGATFAGETYAWVLPPNGVLYSGASLSTPSTTLEFDTVLGFNYVQLTVGDGYSPCNVTESVPMIIYNNYPTASFYVKPNICIGDSVTIALSNIGPGATTFTWDFDGATVIAASSNSGGPFIVTWPSAGIYTIALTAISNLNCPSHPILDTVQVHAYPDAQIATPIRIDSIAPAFCIGDSVLLSALNYVSDNSYVWAPANFFEQWNVNRTYGAIRNAGYVYLTVTDPFGCVAVDSMLFDAQSCCQVYFPKCVYAEWRWP